jgi:hypothetical protein
MTYTFYNNCVSWPPHDVWRSGGLCDMIDSGITITRRTFLRNVGQSALAEFEAGLGYPFGKLTMAGDCAVSYLRGKLHGHRVYWVDHSSIEYVFVPDNFSTTRRV